jgi:hypothetical protein
VAPPTTIRIDGRFCGPPRFGNGGYTCGRLAAFLPGVAVVRLRIGAPLDVDLRVEVNGTEARLFHEATLVAEARATTLDLEPPKAPTIDEAVAASKVSPGLVAHPLPRCFACGPQREAGDGLRILPGPVPGRDLLAAPWVPHAACADGPRVRPEFVWAALDCPSGWAVGETPEGSAILLGELCARIDGPVLTGQRHVITGWSVGTEGRKRMAGAAIYTETGQPLAVARATWIVVPRSAIE